MFFGGGWREERGLVRRPGDIALPDTLSVWWVEDSDDKFLGLSPLEPRIKARNCHERVENIEHKTTTW
jgi:hypothetical protein